MDNTVDLQTESIYNSIKDNMINQLDKYYIRDISQMIMDYIENDLINKILKEHRDKIEHLQKTEYYLERLKDIVDMCNNIKELKNKKIIIVLDRRDMYENGKKEQQKHIKFLGNMIKKKIKYAKISLGKLCGFVYNNSFAFGKIYYETIKDSLVLEKKQALISFNKKHIPKYNHDALETCINGVFMSRLKYNSLLRSNNFKRERVNPIKSLKLVEKLLPVPSPVILTENMYGEHDYFEFIQPYKGNKGTFLFEYMLIEKK